MSEAAAGPARRWSLRAGSLTWRLAASVAFWVAVGLGLLAWFVVRTDARQIQAAADAQLGGAVGAGVNRKGLAHMVAVHHIDQGQHAAHGVEPFLP